MKYFSEKEFKAFKKKSSRICVLPRYINDDGMFEILEIDFMYKVDFINESGGEFANDMEINLSNMTVLSHKKGKVLSKVVFVPRN